MNFQQLDYALAVNKEQHFGLAAESCNITQATLSAMIKKLEEELGYFLFDRSHKPVKTTEKGIRFMELARSIINQQAEMKLLSNQTETLEGKLTLGIIPTVANSLLPIILTTILKDNPKLELEISEITTEEIKKQLIADKIDLGILATPLKEPLLQEHVLYYEPMMVYGVKEKNKSYVSSEDIKGGNVWLLEEGHCFRSQALVICEIKEKEIGLNNLKFRGNSFETLLNLSDSFGGYTLLPELYFNTMDENKKSITKHFKKPIPVREISIVSYRPHTHTEAINYLTDLIQNAVLLSSYKLKNNEMDVIGF